MNCFISVILKSHHNRRVGLSETEEGRERRKRRRQDSWNRESKPGIRDKRGEVRQRWQGLRGVVN